MVYKSIDHRKQPLIIFFYNDVEKVRAELALFSIEKVRTLHLTSFLLSVLLIIDNSYKPISTQEF